MGAKLAYMGHALKTRLNGATNMRGILCSRSKLDSRNKALASADQLGTCTLFTFAILQPTADKPNKSIEAQVDNCIYACIQKTPCIDT